MTRLTEEQIVGAWNADFEARGFLGFGGHSFDYQLRVIAFAHRIAALAVQEVERGVDPCYKQESEMAWAALGQDVTRAFNPSELGSEILKLRAALAEVTNERDGARVDLDRLVDERGALRAQLAALAQPEGTK
jgi:hypothetical protein